MRRTSKGGIISNNKIGYNYLVNKKQKILRKYLDIIKGK